MIIGKVLETASNTYRGEHEAPDQNSGRPLHDLSEVYPKDIYTLSPQMASRYYGHGIDIDNLSISIIQNSYKKPNSRIKIYRAVPNLANKEDLKKANALQNLLNYYKAHNFFPVNNEIVNELEDEIKREYNKDFVGNDYDKLQDLVVERMRKKLDSMSNNPTMRLKINPGDWVTINKPYAVEHGKGHLKNHFKILTKTVKASELYNSGDSIHEWGYSP